MGWRTPVFDSDGNLTPDDEPMRMETLGPPREWRREWCPLHIPLAVYGGGGGVIDDQGQTYYPGGAPRIGTAPDINDEGCAECARLRSLPAYCRHCLFGEILAYWQICPNAYPAC